MFSAYKPPPRNTSRDTINSAATLGGTVLGAVGGGLAGGPQGAIAGGQAGAGIGGALAGMIGGGPQQEERVGSGIGLGLMGAQNYYKDKKQYGEVQTKGDGGDAGVAAKLKPMFSSVSETSPVPTDPAMDDTNPSKWNYRGRPMMSKPLY